MGLVKGRDVPGYQELLEACREVQGGLVKRAQETLVQAYWFFGLTIKQFEDEGKIERHYRDRTIACLAEDLRMNTTSVYRALRFAIACPTQMEYDSVRIKCESLGSTWTWTYVRNNVLPADVKRPELYGGKANVADQAMLEVERLASRTEALHEMLKRDDIPVDKRREMAGVVSQSLQVIQDIVGDTQKQVLPPDNIAASSYLDFIRGLPCIICDAVPSDPHHIETGGVGMKGSDYLTIPLCREHHDDLHQKGKESFAKWHGIDLYREVSKCLVRFIEGDTT